MPHLSGDDWKYAADYVHLPPITNIALSRVHHYAVKLDLQSGQLTTYWEADPVTEAYVAAR